MPLDYVQDGSITLNLSPSATGQLDLGNEWITLSARFGGVPRELFVPVGAVVGIFARENGAGMEFDYEPTVELSSSQAPTDLQPTLSAVDSKYEITSKGDEKSSAKPPRPPHLQRIK